MNTEKNSESTSLIDRNLYNARTIMVFGEINQELANQVISRLLAMSAENNDDIKVVICSQGGHVEAGDAIHDFIRYIRPRVIAIGSGWVASAGALIFLGAEKQNRFCLPNTRFLLHQPLGTARGNAIELEIEANEILKTRERINRIIARETGQSFQKVEINTDRNFWIPAEEAADYGLITKIISSAEELDQIM